MTVLVAALLCAAPAYTQDDDYARQVAQERGQAEFEAPQLAEVLGLKPGVTVADVGTGGGAMAIVLGRPVGSGRVYAKSDTCLSLTATGRWRYSARSATTGSTRVARCAAMNAASAATTRERFWRGAPP